MPTLKDLENIILKGGTGRKKAIQKVESIISDIADCIKKLNDLKNDVKNFQAKCQAAKTVGTTVGVTGSVLTTGKIDVFFLIFYSVYFISYYERLIQTFLFYSRCYRRIFYWWCYLGGRCCNPRYCIRRYRNSH